MKLGVAFSWHVHPWETLLDLVRRAEQLGFDAAFVDGDISMLGGPRRTDVLHGWTVTTALLAHTERIGIGSIRLVHHWNTAQLAQAVATAERLFPGRLRFLISIGDRPHDERFGLAQAPPRERVAWLAEMLEALRALWRGETVTRAGRFVRLDGATVQPAVRVPVAVAGRGPRLLEVVAEHADVWEVNLPPVAALVEPAAEKLHRACERLGRDPGALARSMWIFTRVDGALDPAAALPQFRRLNPWFDWIPDDQIAPSLVVGPAGACRERLAGIAEAFGLALPTVDLSGLDASASRLALEALAPEKLR